ncbi:uncharacterized protein LOC136033261 isoform X2 [Artemia franciscana]|uniref:uncharacterized protein LOC136033261 isoform X2 n=1 Tax=Artemia franciscana TaxID=6661 RepID=UPI0032DB73BD
MPYPTCMGKRMSRNIIVRREVAVYFQNIDPPLCPEIVACFDDEEDVIEEVSDVDDEENEIEGAGDVDDLEDEEDVGDVDDVENEEENIPPAPERPPQRVPENYQSDWYYELTENTGNALRPGDLLQFRPAKMWG